MKIKVKNITRDSLISVLNKKTNRVIELYPGESRDLVVDNNEDVEQYRRSYEALGIDISIINEVVEPIKEVVFEEPKPKRRRSSKKEAEPVEEPKEEEAPVEEPKEEEAPVEEPKEEVEVTESAE